MWVCSDYNHRDVLQTLVGAHHCKDFNPRYTRQTQIQKDDIRRAFRKVLYGNLSMQYDLRSVACQVHDMPEQSNNVSIVLNNQCKRFLHSLSLSRTSANLYIMTTRRVSLRMVTEIFQKL